MKNWSLGQRIGAGFAGVLVIVAALAATSIREFTLIGHSAHYLAEEGIPKNLDLLRIQGYIRENLGLVQAYPHAEDRAAVEAEVARNVAEIDRLIAGYATHLDDADEKKAFEEFTALRSEWVVAFKRFVALQKQGQAEAAAGWLTDQVLPAYHDVDQCFERMEETSRRELVRAEQEILDDVRVGIRSAWAWSIGAALAATAVAVGVSLSAGRLLRRTADVMITSSQEVVAAAGQVSSAAASLANGATEQAAALEQTSSSMTEMQGSTRGNHEQTVAARKMAAEAQTAADAGGQAAVKLTGAMQDLAASSGQITKIVKTIDEIAFQTNILALNAAVEAARAGEAGAGFAVVAEEVRSLAQRSAQAAKETAEKIQAAMARSDEGVRISGDVTANLTTINQKVHQLNGIIESLDASSSQQAEGIRQIGAAVGQLDQVTQGNAAAAEQASAAAEEMNQQALSLNELVGDLMKLAGGRRQNDAIGLAGSIRPGGSRRLDSDGSGAAAAPAPAGQPHTLPIKAVRQHDEFFGAEDETARPLARG